MPIPRLKRIRLASIVLCAALLGVSSLPCDAAREAASTTARGAQAAESKQQSRITGVSIAGSEPAGTFGGVAYKRTWGTVSGVVAPGKRYSASTNCLTTPTATTITSPNLKLSRRRNRARIRRSSSKRKIGAFRFSSTRCMRSRLQDRHPPQPTAEIPETAFFSRMRLPMRACSGRRGSPRACRRSGGRGRSDHPRLWPHARRAHASWTPNRPWISDPTIR